MELRDFKFIHSTFINNNIHILAKNNKMAYEILYKHYENANEYYLNN